MTASLYPPNRDLDPAWSPDTVAVQAGRPQRITGAPVNHGLVLSSTYLHDTALLYARDGNIGWGAFEEALGALDGGQAISFATGLAAAQAIADLVPTGGVAVLPTVAYYGVRNIFERMEAHGRLTIRWVQPDETDAVLAALDGASMVWMESVANPLLVVADVPAIATAARARGVVSVVDATFATPLRQRPLALGADIVLHSATKYLGGHSDLTLGAAVCASAEHAQFLSQYRHDHGAVPGVLEAFLALRGLRTLDVRLERSEASAGILALRLQDHPRIAVVHYPGLASDPNHERAVRALTGGFGAMLSFEVDGTVKETERFLAALQLLTHATSLGGVESLIERRARYAGDASVVNATLCRMSIGIENVDDLWRDLEQALAIAFA